MSESPISSKVQSLPVAEAGRRVLIKGQQTKSVIIDADSKKIEANWYPYTGPKFRLFEGMTRGLFGRGIGGLLGFAKNGLALESLSQKPRGKA